MLRARGVRAILDGTVGSVVGVFWAETVPNTGEIVGTVVDVTPWMPDGNAIGDACLSAFCMIVNLVYGHRYEYNILMGRPLGYSGVGSE